MAVKNEEARKRMGAKIAALRNFRGMTQRDLEEKSGISQPHITRIERGAYDIRLDTLDTLAKAMDAEVEIVPNKH